jgi:hypothetical protein
MDRTTTPPRSIVTSNATLSLLEPGVIEQRFHPGSQFSPASSVANKAALDELCSHHGPCALILICPQGMQVNGPMMNNDNYRDQRHKQNIRALAMAVDSQVLYMACKLYFMYHPQAFETQVFEEERDALAWLRGVLARQGAA